MTLAPKTGTFNLNERFQALEKRVAELEGRIVINDNRVSERCHIKPSKYSIGFDCFWAEYPKRKGKKDAWKAWQKEKLETMVLRIVESIKEHMEHDESWAKENGSFIPLPGSYLRGARWEDEFDKPNTDGGEW